jgi:hypothetical protein
MGLHSLLTGIALPFLPSAKLNSAKYKLEGVWKELVMVYLRYYPSICLEV